MSDRADDSGEPPAASLEEVAQRLRGLEARLERLERKLGERSPESYSEAAPADTPAAWLAGVLASPAPVAPVLGRALLGIAGAYLLRALTEMGALPLLAGVSLGIVYATAWMGFAARTPGHRRLEITVYSVTSVLILAPLIWEATVRFQALSAQAAAGVLAGFTILGLMVSWRKNVTVLVWITLLSGIFTAWILLVSTKDALPFTLALLAVAAAVEVSACLEHWLPERWVAAGAANLAVLFLTHLAVRKVPAEAYAALPVAAASGVQVALLGIYLTSTTVRTLVRRFPFTAFEATQCAVAFLLGTGGALAAAQVSGTVPFAMPAFTLICGAACYAVSFAYLERRGSHDRNFYTYSTFGLALALAGTWLLLDGTALVAVWSCLAVGCIVASSLGRRLTLRWHGVLYLILAAVASGAALEAGRLLLGNGVGLSGVSPGGWVAAAAVAVCYAAAMRYQRPAPPGRTAFGLSLAISALLVWHAAGLAAGAITGLYQGLAGAEASPSYHATFRTAALTCASLLLAWGALRWSRPEWGRLVYPLMILAGYKLVVQDLRGDRTMALFLSLLLYGGSLVLLPRFLRLLRTDRTGA